jgi:hypothetical protein
MKQVFYIIRIAMLLIFAMALIFGVIGLPILFLTQTSIPTIGYIGIVSLLISCIFFVYNWYNNYWLGEDYKQLSTWQLVVITILTFMLILTLMFAVL